MPRFVEYKEKYGAAGRRRIHTSRRPVSDYEIWIARRTRVSGPLFLDDFHALKYL